MTINHVPYLGRAWVEAEHECWDLVRQVLFDQAGVRLPRVECDTRSVEAIAHEFNTHPLTGAFDRVQIPQPLDVVSMRRYENFDHIGIFTGALILHCDRNTGTIAQSVFDLSASGLTVLGYHRLNEDYLSKIACR